MLIVIYFIENKLAEFFHIIAFINIVNCYYLIDNLTKLPEFI